MLESKSSEVSISNLLDSLIKSVFHDVQPTRTTDSALPVTTSFGIIDRSSVRDKIALNERQLKRCRRKAYEILLKKHASEGPIQRDEGYSERENPLSDLKYSYFKLCLSVGQTNALSLDLFMPRKRKRLQQRQTTFAECIDFIENNEYFRGEKSEGHSVLSFLLSLKNSIEEDGNESKNSYFALEPLSTQPKITYEAKYFKLDWPEKSVEQNPYCSKNVRKILIFPGDKYSKCSSQDSQSPSNKSNSSTRRQTSEIIKRMPAPIHVMSTKWEYLGQKFYLNVDNAPFEWPFEKKFVSENQFALMHFAATKALAHKQLFEAKIVSMEKFVEHVKALLVGIESDAFVYHEQAQSFSIVKHLTIRNVLPETIEKFVESFIECGTCFKRLKLVTARNFHNFKLKYDGFMFKAICSSLDKYLETFRRAIIFTEDKNLINLAVRVEPLLRQIRSLSQTLAIHPNDAIQEIPRGSEFLGYLYKKIMSMTQRDVLMLLVFILTECCDIYFRNFENWIFRGIIDDPCRELFIEFINHYRPQTKHYFDKAYYVKPYSVPGFLTGWENDTLLCGKYVNLLKLYNPTHPFFSIESPPLRVCLSFVQLQHMENECIDYTRKARSICGPEFSVDEVFRSRSERQAEMARRVAQKFKSDVEQWRRECVEKESDKREQQELKRMYLLQQIQENRERKIQKRREQIEADREYIRVAEEKEMELVQRENEQRQRNIDYYTELEAIVDAQQKRTEKEIEQLNTKLNPKTVESVVMTSEEIQIDESIYASPKEGDEDKSEASIESVYFDADKNLSMMNDSPKMKRSESDLINSNEPIEAELVDRKRNKANAMASNIVLDDKNHVESTVTARPTSTVLTEAQKNKLKILQQEFDLVVGDLNSNPLPLTRSIQHDEMSELQRNRLKVLSCEYDVPIVKLQEVQSSEVTSEFERNRLASMATNWSVGDPGDVNANKMTLSEKKTSASSRSPLKASLSLELNDDKAKSEKCLQAKGSQSDFVLSPMSTSSDGPLVDAIAEEFKTAREKLKIHLNVAQVNDDVPAIAETPFSALNTAGILSKQNGFLFQRSPTQKSFYKNQIPSFSSINFFDISLRLSATKTVKKIGEENSRNESMKSLCVANLTEFLQKSFTIPLQAHLAILNNEILKIFFNDLNIFDHFLSLRNYFFMMDGEFAINISEGILSKLETIRRPCDLLNSHTLHSILENAIHSSITGNDKNADRLSFVNPQIPDHFDFGSPNVLNEIHLTYRVEWPLNLLLSIETIEHYGNVFHHLLKLRRISWQLEQTFYKLKDIRKQSAEMIQRSPQYRHIQQIRHKLLCFVNALQNHITSVALQGSWHRFQNELRTVRSMEELYRCHTKYLKRVEFLCMLNKSSREFYDKIEDVFIIILRFCHNLLAKRWQCGPNGIYSHPKYDKLLSIEIDFDRLIKYIIYAGNKMSQSGYQTEIGEFISMININGYYQN